MALATVLEDEGFSVAATPRTLSATIEAVRMHDPTVAVVAAGLPGADHPVDRLAGTTDVPIVSIARGSPAPRGATAVVRTEGDGVLGVTDGTSAVVEAATRVAVEASEPRWADVTAGPGTDRFEPVPVGNRRLPPAPTLVVGASTGGPSLVQRLLAELPPEAGFRVVVVQHMRDGFEERFAKRLDACSQYAVRTSEEATALDPGMAIVAASGSHVRIVDDADDTITLEVAAEPPMHGVRPAIDPAFSSAARVVAPHRLSAVLLTGMGADGVEGIRAVGKAGGLTVAQDPEEATVDSMPGGAIATGAVDAVATVDEIVESVLDGLDRSGGD
ncbi:chemotaxis-specific methylesterase [Salinarchaeum sp. Harcht-Bsk1]|nr:chemotaxis-specific methylesterase [Salinarchaeum sp. Harcht-Bsk1]